MTRILQSFLVFAFLIPNLGAEVEGEIQFNRDIRPILSDKCFHCHGPDSATREAGLRLDKEEAAKANNDGVIAFVPGDVANSEALYRVFHDDPIEQMPPAKLKRPLSEREKQLLKRWVEQGAEWEQHWAFIPPTRSEPPVTTPANWARNEIDQFVQAKLEAEGLEPSVEAPKTTLIRRVTLDLTGVPPTREEVEAFLADESPNAYEKVVDRLLASPRYGETMTLPWLDASRFADTDGYQFDGPRSMWRWRDWVINAYNDNLPFDQFAIEQLAGDLLPNATLDQKIATGFNRNHRYNSEAGSVVEEFLLENAVDRVDTASTIFLGLTMGCARCHDHKYDPISQKDYYQLIAFFNSTPEAGRAIKYGNSEPYVTAPLPDQSAKLQEMDARISALESGFESGIVKNGFREWEKRIAAGNATLEQPLASYGLVHYLPLEETTEGMKALKGEAKFAPGLKGNGALFDGGNVLQIGKFGRFRANDRFSIGFWLRPDEVKKGVILSRQKGGTTRPGVALEIEDGKLRFLLISRWVAGAGVVETETKLQAGEWVHVTLTNDGSQSANGQKIYLNGELAEVEVVHNTNSNVGGVGANEAFRLGGGIYGPNFRGAIDEFRYYDRTLWSEEAKLASLLPEKHDVRSVYFREHKMKDVYDAWMKARIDRQKYFDTLPTSMVMKELPKPKPTYLRVRGVYDQMGELVQRNVPAELPRMPSSYPRNRLGFAKWLVDGNNPLTPRVTVNRWWQRYFGTGLVKTSEDFGMQGELPSHPELLDWLAVELFESGWDVKAMQKLIVMSATYRQSSVITPELLERDPENRLLARKTRMRLPAHTIRDQALFAGGLLAERVGGPSVSPYQPANLWAEMSMGMKYKQSKGDDLFRRSLYTIWKRTVAPPSMAILDAADREACWVGAKRTNTPLQALTLLNETAFVESARHLATQLLESESPVSDGFKTVAARVPTDRELKVLQSALDEYRKEFQASPEAATKLIAIGTTPVPKGVDAVELAAHTAFANVLLNLDEVITKE